jgi:molecular chaperone GrpE (heat shock protein)
MLDFKQELQKLLDREARPLPGDGGIAEAAMAGQKALAALGKRQSELSMQVEEIYDIVGSMDTATLQEAMRSEQARADGLAGAVVGLCDILEDFCAYAQNSGDAELDRQARMMLGNSGSLLERCGFARLGDVGQPLDPEIHAAQSAVFSQIPRECVAQVLQSGYRYCGAVVRKAAVVLSKGTGDETWEEAGEETLEVIWEEAGEKALEAAGEEAGEETLEATWEEAGKEAGKEALEAAWEETGKGAEEEAYGQDCWN